MPTARNLRLAFTVACLLPVLADAQTQPDTITPSPVVTATEREQLIRGIITRFRQTYIFPEISEMVARALDQSLRKRTYDSLVQGEALADALTRDLRAITSDQHVMVRFSERPLPAMSEVETPPTAESRAKLNQQQRSLNYGFLKVERFPGNVGFVGIDFMADPEFAGETAAAAMTLIANCDALIIDLRYNGGGNSRMVALLASYLFDGDPVHLNDIVVPASKALKQSWTLPWVAGRKFGGTKPLYILTSAKTFSAAEEFAYNLQVLKRATIVGEKTRGGAHPSGRYRITEHFGVMVPAARALNPVTKTNWEGTGVAPEITASKDDALRVAQLKALAWLIAQGEPALKAEREKRRVSLETEK